MNSNENTGRKVCICIPTYNSSSTISKTIESLLNQTYKDLVILVIDNASTDSTVGIVKEYAKKDKRIEIIESSNNIGAEGNFTRCIQLARGEYTAIFHSDDIYESSIVEKQVAFLEKYLQVGAVFTSASLINENDKLIGKAFIPKYYTNSDGYSRIYNFSSIFKDILKYGNFFICPSAMVRTKIYKEEIKVWRGEMFHTSADLDTWLRILQNHYVGILPEKLIRYRLSCFNGTFKYQNLRTIRSDLLRVIDYYLMQQEVSVFVTHHDLKNYRHQEKMDQLKIANNYLVLGKYGLAKKTCRSIFSCELFMGVFTMFRGWRIFFLWMYINIAITLKIKKSIL